MSHTPKPWFLYESDEAIFILNEDSDVIAQIELDTPGIDDPMANARLIRAAPDLLTELEQLAAKYLKLGDGDDRVLKLLARVRKGVES